MNDYHDDQTKLTKTLTCSKERPPKALEYFSRLSSFSSWVTEVVEGSGEVERLPVGDVAVEESSERGGDTGEGCCCGGSCCCGGCCSGMG